MKYLTADVRHYHDTMDVQILTRDGVRAVELKRLCTLGEFYLAFVELVAVLGGYMKRKGGTAMPDSTLTPGYWHVLQPFLSEIASAEEVWAACEAGDPELFDAFAQAALLDYWPTAFDAPRNTHDALTQLKHPLRLAHGFSTTMTLGTTASAVLQRRFEQGLSMMRDSGYSIKSEELLREIFDLVQREATFLIHTRP